MACVFEIPLCCAAECQCHDQWHSFGPLIAARCPSSPSVLIPCDEYWDGPPKGSFAPAPAHSPWAPLPPPQFEVDYLARCRARKERAKLARLAPRKALVVAPPHLFPCVLPTRKVVEVQESRRAFIERAVKAQASKPAFINICGVACPPIRGKWFAYARRSLEKFQDWRKRVRGMVEAKKLAKAMKYEDVWIGWSLDRQIDWLSSRISARSSHYACLPVDQEDKLTSTFEWKKVKFQPKLRVERVKNMGPAHYADQRLALKMRYARLEADRLELVVRQRLRRAAVVISDVKTHRVISLRAALIKNIEQYVRKQCVEKSIDPQPWGEMDDSKDQAGVDPQPKSDKKSNVILEDKESSSVAASLPPVPVKNEYACLVIPKKTVQVRDYTDRWITIKQGSWTSQNFGEELFRLTLPQELLKNKVFRNSPNYMPFRNHTYWHGAMKVKIVINANARQHGQLQASWYPLAGMDLNFESLRTNVFTASQRSHILITASFSNSGELVIPFSYFNPTLCVSRGPKTWDDEDSSISDDVFANLGILTCYVLSPLTVAETTPRVVGYSVLVAFEDPQFNGMIDASLVEGEMFSMASLFAMQEAQNFFDANRDNPTLTATGMPVIPVNSGSWCIGNGMPEWTNVLRLNPNSTLPYEAGRVPAKDEMKIDFIKKIYGLIKTIHWTAQRNAGTLLWTTDAAPVMPIQNYPPVPVTLKDVVYHSYCLPPVAVLSSLFSWWRGELKLRIDVVGAVELTGRLLVAYVPRYYKEITMEQAINCPHSIFDLQTDNRQFNFSIPYISDRLFWPRSRVLLDEYASFPAPGTIYMFVYNPLIANASIPSDCNLLIYIAGGEDFELSVPAFPTIGTAFFPDVRVDNKTAHQLISISGYSPVYAGIWHSFYFSDGTSMSPPILRYGPVSDHIAQFNIVGDYGSILYTPLKLKNDSVLTRASSLYALYVSGSGFDTTGATTGDFAFTITDMKARAFVGFIDQYGYCYVCVFPADEAHFTFTEYTKLITNEVCVPAKKLIKNYRINLASMAKLVCQFYQKFLFQSRDDPTYKHTYPTGTNSLQFFKSYAISQGNVYPTDPYVLVPMLSRGEAGDQRSAAATSASRPQATACGRQVGSQKAFGEQFVDLKDLCRRYQLYAKGQIKLGAKADAERVVTLKFPVLPQGLDIVSILNSEVNHFWNKTRDGPLGIILSGFRFFCGSVRFRLACDGFASSSVAYNNQAVKVFVQHRPEMSLTTAAVNHRSTSLLGTDDIELPGYASYFQFDSINNVICFEVPYYKSSIRTLLQRPAESVPAKENSSLGEIAVGVTLQPDFNVNRLHYEIYYKLGDDARASDFIGFPPVVDITRIAPVEVNETKGFEVIDNITEGEMGVWDWMPGFKSACNISDAAEKVAQVDVEKLNATISESSSFISSLKENVRNCVPTFTAIKSKIDKYLGLIINVITNFVHCLLNLNIRSIVTAIVSIFTQIKLVSFQCADRLIDSLFSLFKSENPSAPDELKEVAKEIITGESDDSTFVDVTRIVEEEKSHRAAYLSTLIAGVAAVFALGPRICGSDFKSCSMLLFEGIRKFAITANCLFTFIKNNLVVMQRIGNILVDGTPKMQDIAFLEKEQAEMYAWACEVIEFTDPWKESELFTNMKKASRVYFLSAAGSLILLKLSNIKLSMSQISILNKLRDQIDALRNRLAKAHMAPPVRFVPFIYEITGPTGTGKSEILNDLPYKLLDHLGLKFRGEIIYHRALGNAYWNNCRNQPVCSIDEKFPIAKQGFDDVQIAELFQLKSRCIFNPPMADLPDKNIRYNPLIVQYASNNAFPQLTGVLDSTAICRRRDVLIRVGFSAEVHDWWTKQGRVGIIVMNALPFRWRKDWAGLNFYIKGDVLSEVNDYVGPYTYAAFVVEMKKRWLEYYTDEFKKFQAHLTKSLSLYPENDISFKSFDERWQELIDVEDPNTKVKEFRAAYQAVLVAYKEKQITEQVREARVMKLLKQFLGESESNISDEKMCERIKSARAENKKFVLEPLDVKLTKSPTAIVGESDDVEVVSKTTVSEREKCDSIYKNCFKNKKNCPHDLLIHLSELSDDLFKFDRATNTWKISHFHLDAALAKVNDGRAFKDCLTVRDFSFGGEELTSCNSALQVHANPELIFTDDEIGRYVISQNSCTLICKFKDVYNRQKFYRSYINNSPILKTRQSTGAIDQLLSELPDEYSDNLQQKILDSKKEMEKVKEEVGFFKGLYENLKEKLMTIPWKKWFSKLAMVLGVFFFIGSIYKLWSCVVGPSEFEDNLKGVSDASVGMAGLNLCVGGVSLMHHGQRLQTVQAEGFTSGDVRQGRTSKKTPVSIARRQLSVMSPQGQINDQLASAVQNKIRRNTFFLQMSDPSGEVVHGRAMGICGSYALIIDHLWESFKNFKENRLVFNFEYIGAAVPKTTAITIDFKQCKYTKFNDSALGLIQLPKQLGCFEDIRNFILPATRHMYVNGDGMVLELTGGKNGEVVNYTHMVKYHLEGKIEAVGGKLFSNFTTGETYRYPSFHGKGRCGSILLALDQTAPICAVHVAGNGNSGFAESIYREQFSNLTNVISKSSPTFGEAVDVSKQKWFVDAQVKGLGLVSSKFASRAATRSRIIPSEVQESDISPFPVVTDLSVLDKKDPRIADAPFSPMLEGVKHHGKPLLPFNSVDLAVAVEDYKNLILAKCVPQRPDVGVLPVLTAINGIEGKELYDHIEWDSSEGFPFSSLRPAGAHDKRWMFDFDGDRCIGFNKILEQAMEKKWKQRLNDEIPETVFIDCLKDCRVKKEKVLEPGKTRIFSIAPVDFTIQQRQCTLDFVTAFMANRLDLEHAIGINVNSTEWTDLAGKLLQTGDSILTGDYSKFGDTIPVEIVHAAFQIIIEWYRFNNILTWEHEQQLKIMGHEIANSVHLMFNFLYQVVCGQPSGNSLTVIINSIANSLYIRLAWLGIMRGTQYCSLSDLHKLVRWFSYGDDIIAALNDLIKDLFNAQTVCDFFSLYKLKFTNANKGAEIVPFTNLAEAEFLKCSFAPHPILTHPQIMLAPLEINSIVETVNWINSDYTDKRLMTLQVCDDALRNAFGRGPEFYSNFRQQLITFWQRLGVHYRADTWTQLNYKIFDLGIVFQPYIKALFTKNNPI